MTITISIPVIVAILSLIGLAACWFGVLYFGMSEVGPEWLSLAVFVLGVLCAVTFLVSISLSFWELLT